MKSLASPRGGLGLALIALTLQPIVLAANLTDCIADVLKLVSVDAGDATKGYLQAAEEDNVLKLATTSKDITNDVLKTVSTCKDASITLYPPCSEHGDRPLGPHARSCGGDDQVVQATGEKRCAQYASQVNSLATNDIFFGKKQEYVFHCNNHAFDGVNGCFYDCSTCSQCASQVAPVPPAPAGADPATATNGLTGKGNHFVLLATLDPSEQNPDDIALAEAVPQSRKQRKRDNEDEKMPVPLADHARSKRFLSRVKSLFGRVAISDLTPVPSSTWWKWQTKEDGYTRWGRKPPWAWALSYDTDFTSISELTIGKAPKNGLPTVASGQYDGTWEADHVLEGQVLSQFFASNQLRYNFLLRELTAEWEGPDPPENTVVTSFTYYGTAWIQQVVTLLNGAGNIQPLEKSLNGFKGGLFRGFNQNYNPNNDLLITGVLLYMRQTTAMHDTTAHDIGQILDTVPNAGGQFGAEFEAFAKNKWRSVWTLLASQYNQAANNKPLLTPQSMSTVMPDYDCAPPLGDTAPPPPP